MENVKRDKTPDRLSIDPVFDSPVFDKNWYNRYIEKQTKAQESSQILHDFSQKKHSKAHDKRMSK